MPYGRKRALEIATTLALDPEMMLLDEPMAPLDAGQREAFGAVMAEHLSAGGMILASVHDPLPIPARNVEIGA